MNWWKDLKGKVRLNEPLKNHTTFKIGGPAKFFIVPKDINDLKLLLSLLKRYKISFLVIGAGSNILVSDKGIKHTVICLDSAYFRKVSLKNNYLEAGSAAGLNQVILASGRQGLSGLEFLVGIPGTVGGALVMNAGITEKNNLSTTLRIDGEPFDKFRMLRRVLSKVEARSRTGKNIGDLVEDVTIMDYNGNIKTLNKKDIKFGYRRSNLSKYIILGARLKLVKKNKQEIKAKINRYLKLRRAQQDLSSASVGCIFQNPKGDSAGRLIDLCALKGVRIADACISWKHANFILNTGNAKAGDILKLMDIIKEKVEDRFNITLKPEIKIWN